MKTESLFSPNWFSRNGDTPDIIVFHQKNRSFQSAKRRYLSEKTRESVHYYITLSGKIYRFLPLTVAACNDVCSSNDPLRVDHWSRAVSRIVRDRKKDPSSYTVSVEFEGVESGFLTKAQFEAGVFSIKEIIHEIKEIYGKEISVDREHFIGRYKVAPLISPYSPGFDFPLGKLIDACKT